ncbi:T9SS type A sorting domain-containing protein [Mangrovibacterium diazotrophicum]|uniref:Putative secreted protein (Por secretion system target) n=1 Tax=Mangrovibacterium diazotrophicum TaxID=1261403 RepID=A0A419W5B0_9BACT|nr:T9SS type A sorting domain-containing protein [Mangrovibacterium diazotrophicum]RKD90661.1 putative secreted protein (Por secretion system target) [Mangrovibacterium diazotrophicum]
MKKATFYKAFCLLVLTILTSQSLRSQVYYRSLTLSSQAQVDTLSPFDVGSLIISGDDIDDLTPLNFLTSVRNLRISQNKALTSLSGLNNLHTVEENLVITENASLTRLTGLSNLTFIKDDLTIKGNPSLESLSGLDHIVDIGGSFTISDNDGLTNLSGLNNITSIGEYLIISDNNALRRLSGLEKLKSIKGQLNIANNVILRRLSGLDNLRSIGRTTGIITGGHQHYYTWKAIDITNNDALYDLTGLNNLVTVNGTINISNNDALTNLSALSSLTMVSNNLEITQNYSLNNFCGIYPLFSNDGLKGRHFTNNRNALNPTTREIIENGACIPEPTEYVFELITIGEHLYIFTNDTLPSLSELNSPSNLRKYLKSNPIKALLKLNNITEIQEFLDDTALPDLSKLNNLNALLKFLANTSLTSISKLDSLYPLKNYLAKTSPQLLLEQNNLSALRDFLTDNSLSSLTKFDSLTFIGGNLYFLNDAILNKLFAYETPNSIGDFALISSQNSLANTSQLDKLQSITGHFYILTVDEAAKVNKLINLPCWYHLGSPDVFKYSSDISIRRAMPVTAVQPGSIESISIYQNGGTGILRLGVYDDASGVPGKLLTLTPTVTTNHKAGWQTVNLDSTVSISAGQTVWLAFHIGNGASIRYAWRGPARTCNINYPSLYFPTDFGRSTAINISYSIHCCYSPTNVLKKSSQVASEVLLPEYTSAEHSGLNVYPNPFNEKVKFDFTLEKDANVVLEIYNMVGQKIATLVNDRVEAGVRNTIEYLPETDISGIYVYKLDIDGKIQTGKLVRNKE